MFFSMATIEAKGKGPNRKQNRYRIITSAAKTKAQT